MMTVEVWAMSVSFLIVDDEIHICKMIEKFIRDAIPDSCIYMAHNGVDALRMIENETPEIVISDIRIPGMDGIQLVKSAYEMESPSSFIIVSGYKRFEYAHNALKYGVSDYLLKPIDEQELIDAVHGILEKKRTAATSMEEMQRVSDQNQQYHSILRANAFLRLLEGDKTDMSVFSGQHTLFYTLCTQLCGSMELLETKAFCDMIFQNTVNITKSYFIKNEVLTTSFKKDNRIITVIHFSPDTRTVVEEAIIKASDALLRWCSQHEHIYVSIGISRIWHTPAEFPGSFGEASDTACFQLVFGFRRVFRAEQYEDYRKNVSDSVQRELVNVPRILENWSEQKFRSFMNRICLLVFADKKMHPACVYEIYSILTETIFRYVDSLPQVLVEKPDRPWYSIPATSIHAFFSEAEKIFMDYLRKADAEKKNARAAPIVLAQRYIETHLLEDISLEVIADKVGLTPSYFSTLFKNTTSMKFMDYVIKLRMEEARRLLVTTRKPIAEIAEMVGYYDVRAFSKRFKKETGIIPSEFRTFHFNNNIDEW